MFKTHTRYHGTCTDILEDHIASEYGFDSDANMADIVAESVEVEVSPQIPGEYGFNAKYDILWCYDEGMDSYHFYGREE